MKALVTYRRVIDGQLFALFSPEDEEAETWLAQQLPTWTVGGWSNAGCYLDDYDQLVMMPGVARGAEEEFIEAGGEIETRDEAGLGLEDH